jgi:hypothetical protein
MYKPSSLVVACEVTRRTTIDIRTASPTAVHMLILNGWIGTIHPGINFGLGSTVVRDVLKYTELKHMSMKVTVSYKTN